ncbi:MAG: hypothetical protein K8L91_03635 [Anaerolineae bacterium]|nr:hypothetical protein [Anaerolineae bacterium]
MTYMISKRKIGILLALLPMLILPLMGLGMPQMGYAQDAPTATPVPIEIEFGPGPFSLVTPTEGLATLTSYQATLTLTFDGMHDGQPQQWTRTYVMLVAPPARQISITSTGADTTQLYAAEVGGTLYEKRGEQDCMASAIETVGAFANRWEPAGFLTGVIGADEAGSETVNDVVTNHYTFDERALGLFASSFGEMWVAAEGGYLMRYLLTTDGNPAYFGDATEGTVTWDYELTAINQPLVIELPSDCPIGMVDVPVPPDATDVVRAPGMTSYLTAATLTDAAAFAEAQFPAAGWTLTTPLAIADTAALLEFTLGDQLASVILLAQADTTLVIIMVGPPDIPTDPTVPDLGATFEPPPVVPPAGDGSSTDIPLLPDATNVVNMQGLITYSTATSAEEVAAFYEAQITAMGGQVYTPLTIFAGTGVVEFTLNDQLISVMIMSMGGSNSVFVTIE